MEQPSRLSLILIYHINDCCERAVTEGGLLPPFFISTRVGTLTTGARRGKFVYIIACADMAFNFINLLELISSNPAYVFTIAAQHRLFFCHCMEALDLAPKRM